MTPNYSRKEALQLIEQLKGYLDRKRVENGEPRSPEELFSVAPPDAETSAEMARLDAVDDRLKKSDALNKLRKRYRKGYPYEFEDALGGISREFRDCWQLSRKFEARRARVTDALRKCAKVIEDNDISMALSHGDSNVDINSAIFLRTFTNPMICALEAATDDRSGNAWGANQAHRAIIAALVGNDAPNCLISILQEMANEIERGEPSETYAQVARIRSRNGSEIDYTKRRVFALISEHFPDWSSKNKSTADIVNALLLLPKVGGKAVNENDISKMTEKDRKAAEKRAEANAAKAGRRLVLLMSARKR